MIESLHDGFSAESEAPAAISLRVFSVLTQLRLPECRQNRGNTAFVWLWGVKQMHLIMRHFLVFCGYLLCDANLITVAPKKDQ
jgi:hypothetical protein